MAACTRIAGIEAKETNTYKVNPRIEKRADIGAVRPEGRSAYLRTNDDGFCNERFLAMDHFPDLSVRRMEGGHLVATSKLAAGLRPPAPHVRAWREFSAR